MAEKIGLAIGYAQSHPGEAARILEEQPPAETAAFLERLEDDLIAVVLDEMLPAPAARCVREMDADAAARALSRLRAGAAASILRCLPENSREAFLGKMPKRKSLMCAVLLTYAPDMVGAWVDPLALIVPASATAAEALKRVRDDPYDEFSAVCALDAGKKLLGTVTLDALISAPEDKPIAGLVRPSTSSLPDRATLSAIAGHPGWNERDELPVSDRNQKFVGILRHADLRHGLRELSGADTSPDGGNTLMGFVEASFMGLADIVEATVSSSRGGGSASEREKKS
ncbi:MAG: hypothetical protein RIB59_09835 [Rhodospirillales bacterium]